MTNEGATFIFTYYEIRFGIIRFSSVNDTEALVFSYSVFTRFDRPLTIGLSNDFFGSEFSGDLLEMMFYFQGLIITNGAEINIWITHLAHF